jgi:nucleotide-binding universal stress UspA family protein
MKRLLIPTDFSPCANNAINFAVTLSRAFPVEITLLHIHEHPGSTYSEYAGLDKEFKTTMMHESLKKLNEIRTSIMETESVTVIVRQAEGKIKKSILQTAGEVNADMIVMGTLGSGGIKERLWGSNAAAVIGSADIPVIVVPPEYTGYALSKILLATNHFEMNQKMLNPLFELAAVLMARVQVVVFSENKDEAAAVMDHSRKLNDYQQKLQNVYKDQNLETVHLGGSRFDDAIGEYIDKNKIDMLAMVTYQRSFIERLFHPSTTKKVSYHTKIPLLVVPATI